MATAALSAMKVMKDRERAGSVVEFLPVGTSAQIWCIETFVFVVYADGALRYDMSAEHQIAFVYSIRDAFCVTRERCHEMFDDTVGGGYATIEHCLAPRPRMLRIFVVDDAPTGAGPYTLPTDIPPDISSWRYRPDWLEQLKEEVKSTMNCKVEERYTFTLPQHPTGGVVPHHPPPPEEEEA
jgi:hypothetical protein